MEIPLNAEVECRDGAFGRSVYVLIDPLLDQVIHLVVRENLPSNKEYIVPIDDVVETIFETICLRCSKAELEKMDPFVQTEFIEEKVLNYAEYGGGIYGTGSYFYMPYVTSEVIVQVPVKQLQIPLGELAVKRGTRVKATDGYVGKVDEFVINSENSHITSLVMREGHLWGEKNVIIPLSAMGDTDKNTLFLNIDKHAIEALPAFPVKRRWS